MNHLLAAMAFAGLACTSAQATPSSCSLGVLTATYADASTASYTGCTGAWDGNLSPGTSAALATIIGLEFNLPQAAYIGKTGDATNPWTNEPGSVGSGLLNFGVPYDGLFVVGLHAGDQDAPEYPGVPVAQGGDFSLYLFDGAGHGGVVSIAFDTVGVSVNRPGLGRNLSHAALYGGMQLPPTVSPSDSDVGVPPIRVPEPAGLVLLATALLASTSMSRRVPRGVARR